MSSAKIDEEYMVMGLEPRPDKMMKVTLSQEEEEGKDHHYHTSSNSNRSKALVSFGARACIH